MKMKPAKTLLLLASASFLLSASLLGQSSGEAFAKARRLELEEAKVQKALPLYELVLQDPQAPKSMKAQALYRQAICYLKLEEYAKASQVLARLEKAFPQSDQAVQAKLLRRSLGSGGKTLSPRRDLSYEVQNLLVSGVAGLYSNQGWKDFYVNLQRLRLIGAPAIPALHSALKTGETKLKEMAVIALAEQGDEAAFEPLLKRLERGQAMILRARVPSLLTKACTINPKLKTRLKEVFFNPQRKAKGQILEILSTLGALEGDLNPRNFLESQDKELRSSAWKIFGKEALSSASASKEYMKRLLEAWNSRPKERETLAPVLVGALQVAERAGDPLLSEWSNTLQEEAKKGEKPFVKLLSKALNRGAWKKLTPIRLAMVEPYF